MHLIRVIVVSLASFGMLLALGMPVAAQVDTTPPQLVSIAASPTVIDTSASAQQVTVTAVITDDLSGVSAESGLCSDGCLNFYDWFANVSGDTYTATITWPQYSGGEGGIFRDWEVLLVDNAGNDAFLEVDDLYDKGINLAAGVNSFDTSYSRVVSLSLTKTKARGYVDALDESNCWWFVPVSLERKTRSGWKQVGSTLSGWSGGFSFRITKAGKYRAIATEFGLGTPTVTTCLREVDTARSESGDAAV